MKKNAFILLLLLINTAQVHAQVEPLIQTAWHQNKPYNAYCPDGMLAGCVAIAMAQVMNYYRYPSHGIGKNSYSWKKQKLSANFQETWYRWEDMEHPDPSAAQLIYHCGVATWMDYSSSFSGSSEYYAKSALTDYFGYSEDIMLRPRNLYSDKEWSALLRENLDKGWPVIYSSGGHTFIVDGYDESGKFHANMGFGQNGGNRYYSIDELGAKSTSTALVNIHPIEKQANVRQVAIYLNDATTDVINCNEVNSIKSDTPGIMNIFCNDGEVKNYRQEDVTYLKIW